MTNSTTANATMIAVYAAYHRLRALNVARQSAVSSRSCPATSARNTIALSFESKLSANHSGASRLPLRWATTAAITKTAAMHSSRPTTFATASTCTGWTANASPVTSADAGDINSDASFHVNTVAVTCQSTFTV